MNNDLTTSVKSIWVPIAISFAATGVTALLWSGKPGGEAFEYLWLLLAFFVVLIVCATWALVGTIKLIRAITGGRAAKSARSTAACISGFLFPTVVFGYLGFLIATNVRAHIIPPADDTGIKAPKFGAFVPAESAKGIVVIYTTAWCDKCAAAVAHAKATHAEYVEKNVATDAAAKAEFHQVYPSADAIPVIVFGQIKEFGFTVQEFDENYRTFQTR